MSSKLTMCPLFIGIWFFKALRLMEKSEISVIRKKIGYNFLNSIPVHIIAHFLTSHLIFLTSHLKIRKILALTP